MVKKAKQVKPRVKTTILTAKTKQQQLQLLQAADKTIKKYKNIVSKALDKDKEEVEFEIQTLYLDNLRNMSDPQTMMNENTVALMLKKQTADYVREEIYKKELKEAELIGDNERIKELTAEMVESLEVTDFDLKFHNTLMKSVKDIHQLGTKTINLRVQEGDDKVFFKETNGVYDFEGEVK